MEVDHQFTRYFPQTGKLDWYALRWKIEAFHKILKPGCKAEESKLRTANRLANLIAVFCIISWRIFWITTVNRAAPQLPAEIATTPTEIQLLDQLVKDTAKTSTAEPLTHVIPSDLPNWVAIWPEPMILLRAISLSGEDW